MKHYALFTDASLDPRRKCGVGVYLLVPTTFLAASPGSVTRADVTARLKIRRFDNTSSTRLEIQTLIWALEDICQSTNERNRIALQAYTDSQAITGLPGRRAKLEATAFLSKKTSQPLRNAALYRTFYELHDQLCFEVIKVAGHTRAASRDTIHHIFAYVDQEARKALAGC
ncbi:MAG: ribonuclease H [bacterium]|nr:ribonuclease H [bacterium]